MSNIKKARLNLARTYGQANAELSRLSGNVERGIMTVEEATKRAKILAARKGIINKTPMPSSGKYRPRFADAPSQQARMYGGGRFGGNAMPPGRR